MNKRVILTVLDGYGLAPPSEYNAITEANTPFLDQMWRDNPTVTLKTSGLDVGLPLGQMGNSEVGHLNIGAGRVVFQDVTRIDQSIKSGEFFTLRTLHDLLHDLKDRDRQLHVLGLVSEGGVHASLNHLRALLLLCAEHRFKNIALHVFTDGRDTPPHSGIQYVRHVQAWMSELQVGRIATVMGRYYAMDRDQRWDRLERAYRAICFSEGQRASSAVAAVLQSYKNNITDEFIEPFVIDPNDERCRPSKEDGIFFMNFRSDRARQLTDALTDDSFDGFDAPIKIARYVTMTSYHEKYNFPVLFPPVKRVNLLGGIIADAGMKQLRIAETEKYAHVTFFFNGGEDTPFPNEDRILVPSPKVATYDLQPEMSEPEVATKLCNAIRSREYDLIVINYANCDMVGHTGDVQAAMRAVEAVNAGAKAMCEAADESGYAILITADHGNAEQMWDDSTNGPHTAHTTNPVPLALVGAPKEWKLRDGGRLADLAPTVLEILDLPKPEEMTGESLLIR